MEEIINIVRGGIITLLVVQGIVIIILVMIWAELSSIKFLLREVLKNK